MAKRTLRQWLWDGSYEQDSMGAPFNEYMPPYRRMWWWLKRHWLEHWKFWLNFIVAWVAVFVAILQWMKCKP